MSNQTLTQLLNSGRKILWLDYSDYADVLLAQGNTPWLDVATYVALKRTAQSLLRSDVIQLPVESVCAAWVAAHPALREEMASKKRTGFALKTLLADAALREHLLALVNGLRASFANIPLALVCPTPHAWMTHAYQLAHGTHSSLALDEEDVDSGSVYIADFLRIFGESGVDILLLQESVNISPMLELYQSVFNVAAHYRWDAGIQVTGEIAENSLDFVISPQPNTLGRELAAECWIDETVPDYPDNGFFFVRVPADAKPERVLTRIAQLRA
ncbi:hypothetical protein ACG9ZC_00385 [Acinetobacter baumannii]|uniref:hypothetical protein n=1 Tax=Acinetobacter baumannii TaxID=470 RepID=UPI003AF8D5B6